MYKHERGCTVAHCGGSCYEVFKLRLRERLCITMFYIRRQYGVKIPSLVHELDYCNLHRWFEYNTYTINLILNNFFLHSENETR